VNFPDLEKNQQGPNAVNFQTLENYLSVFPSIGKIILNARGSTFLVAEISVNYRFLQKI